MCRHSWFPAVQYANGKIKMSREYWRKKNKAKCRLFDGSGVIPASLTAPSEVDIPCQNGSVIKMSHDTRELLPQ